MQIEAILEIFYLEVGSLCLTNPLKLLGTLIPTYANLGALPHDQSRPITKQEYDLTKVMLLQVQWNQTRRNYFPTAMIHLKKMQSLYFLPMKLFVVLLGLSTSQSFGLNFVATHSERSFSRFQLPFLVSRFHIFECGYFLQE